jgi:hypothetical protein
LHITNRERKREKTGHRLSSPVGSLSIPYASPMVKVLCGRKGIRSPREFPEFLSILVDALAQGNRVQCGVDLAQPFFVFLEDIS